MAERAEIERIIKAVVADRFPDGRIVSVEVEPDSDFDGNPVFLVKVIVENGDRLDAHRASGLTRHVRSRLAAINEYGFPLFSFISRSELGKMNPAAA